MVPKYMHQNRTSANTSINSTKVPALFRKIRWIAGTRNLDWGGGKYDTATEYLKQYGVQNVIYDPFNRSDEENHAALAGTYDTVTLSNVLNVIAERDVRIEAVQGALDHLKPGGRLYISVYEGNHSGVGRRTKPDCWQCNRPLTDYAIEIGEELNLFSVIRHGYITITK